MKTNRSMPKSTIIPELSYPDVREAAEWLCNTFGFVERLRIGDHRAQLTFGDGSVIVTKGNPVSGFTIMVRVSDVGDHFEKVKRSTAGIIQVPTNFPYGERQYVVQDPGGHRWTFSETVADIDPKDWGGMFFD